MTVIKGNRITLPKDFVKALNVQEGDLIRCEFYRIDDILALTVIDPSKRVNVFESLGSAIIGQNNFSAREHRIKINVKENI